MALWATLPVIAGVIAAGADRGVEGGETRTPVVIELFTSEGCSSCPPADALLAKLHREQPFGGVELIVLSEHVDYWNRLGWVDPFSSKAFTQRQNWYSTRWPTRVFTPQAVVDGQKQLIGGDGKGLVEAIREAARAEKLSLSAELGAAEGNRVPVTVEVKGLERVSASDVYLVVAQDELSSEVTRGENKGRRLPHVGVVRSLEKIGRVSAEEPTARGYIELDPEWGSTDLRVVAFVQHRSSRRIVAAVSESIPHTGL